MLLAGEIFANVIISRAVTNLPSKVLAAISVKCIVARGVRSLSLILGATFQAIPVRVCVYVLRALLTLTSNRHNFSHVK